ncbi:hypothetical protein [Helicobacter turcicus]|uniref:Uncharacterized protein n=1 Tax=Helicobacter turcicus TaxID=2867412 RepID=A0ABS7JPI1_9HELI|nr:hypothetical protein [Helicobacter turcicus]MBX7491267.1 hypothetical protein [Helicobacter turcicus]MBX7546094.1 hypothetical protein [Helicobacter turcicus]
MIKILQKHELDALEEALRVSIEKAYQCPISKCERVCLCSCLLANYFSNKLSKALSNNKICETFWNLIQVEFDFKHDDNILAVILKEQNINRGVLEKIKTIYCFNKKSNN